MLWYKYWQKYSYFQYPNIYSVIGLDVFLIPWLSWNVLFTWLYVNFAWRFKRWWWFTSHLISTISILKKEYKKNGQRSASLYEFPKTCDSIHNLNLSFYLNSFLNVLHFAIYQKILFRSIANSRQKFQRWFFWRNKAGRTGRSAIVSPSSIIPNWKSPFEEVLGMALLRGKLPNGLSCIGLSWSYLLHFFHKKSQ